MTKIFKTRHKTDQYTIDTELRTASEQHKDSCVCGAVGTRSALEALRLCLGCVRLCALQIDIYIYSEVRPVR